MPQADLKQPTIIETPKAFLVVLWIPVHVLKAMTAFRATRSVNVNGWVGVKPSEDDAEYTPIRLVAFIPRKAGVYATNLYLPEGKSETGWTSESKYSAQHFQVEGNGKTATIKAIRHAEAIRLLGGEPPEAATAGDLGDLV